MAEIAILGGNGVYARHLIPRLVAAGHGVRALVRRPEAAGVARGCGADIHIADIFDGDSLRAGLAGCDTCINLATSLPGPSGRGDFAVNDRVRTEGVPVLLESCRAAGIGRFVQQGIALVGGSGASLADEAAIVALDDDHPSAGPVAAALAMEAMVRESTLDWVILRGGLFYGPGTGFDADWVARASVGKLRLPGDGSDYVSLIHIADMAAATIDALTVWPSRETLIICDDTPVRWRELFDFVAAMVGGAPPQAGGRLGFPGFRMSNAKARRMLGWAPFYSDYRAGLIR
ncbi:NAD-dependent epimerase/dehydratase family protein [Sphingopyxis sp. MSC1_008]|jgi:nucleoside-diphosphate-sugar epimerase|uniref:NAD-dependent epimerase/dehydratase family protein n=1 Tax=Sphingopyxis sp. MSC1_008 TaxID=2909265 RepID=UPI0020BF9BE1|nr:NAD(P)-dependent oxidoreductase [Sphingopyxis sp. MSC1_008]